MSDQVPRPDGVADPAGRHELAPATLAITAGRPRRTPDAPLNPPVVLSSTYVARDGDSGPSDRVYGRWGNPTWTAFEEVLGGLEGGRALLFSSGMAATAAVLSTIPPGATVVCPDAAYAGTLSLLHAQDDEGRVQLRTVDVVDTDAVAQAVRGADLVWLETPTNPLLEIVDLPAVVGAAHAEGCRVAVDATLATPITLRALDLGVDVVVHSATKFLAGHADAVLGAAVTPTSSEGNELAARLHAHRTLHGAIAGPWEAWLAVRGMRTLALRVHHAGGSALEIARRLTGHPAVTRVRHPGLPEDPGHERARSYLHGFGAVVSVELHGDAATAERVAAATRIWVPATSFGGVESSLERRRRHASEPLAVPENLLRLSVGIEDVEDLWSDLDRALRLALPGRG